MDAKSTDYRDRPGLVALAEEMARHGKERGAPVREVMGLLGDRWSTLILLVLGTGEWRHAELRRVLAQISAERAISQRVLTLKLRTLERHGFVLRSVTDDVPPRVSYRLSVLGADLLSETRRTIDWVNAHEKEIGAAQQRFDLAE